MRTAGREDARLAWVLAFERPEHERRFDVHGGDGDEALDGSGGALLGREAAAFSAAASGWLRRAGAEGVREPGPGDRVLAQGGHARVRRRGYLVATVRDSESDDLSGSLIDNLFVTQNTEFDFRPDDSGTIPQPPPP